MKIKVLADPDSVAKEALGSLPRRLGTLLPWGRFVLAVSGGRTPWLMLWRFGEAKTFLGEMCMLVQVDERVCALLGHPDRNLTSICKKACWSTASLLPLGIHAMPVESPRTLEAAAMQYA